VHRLGVVSALLLLAGCLGGESNLPLGSNCTDDDECALGLDDCGTNAICSNVPGSYECACEDGYEGDGITCTNVDECTAGTHTCLGVGSECVDTTPGFDCVCRPGYLGDGVTCTPDPDTAVADVSAHPIQITVAGIGDFEIYGLSRIGWDFEIVETPIVGGNGRTHKDIAQVLWPDITMMEINGSGADITNLVAWAEEGEVATPHDVTVALEGVAGESFTVNLLGARAISADTTVITGSTTDEMTAMVIRLGFGVTTGTPLIDRVANTLPHAGVYPACATPGRAVEIQGVTTVTATIQDLCWPLDELAMPTVGTSEQIVLNNLRYGEPIYQWMRSVTQFSGLPFERRSISVIEYDLSVSPKIISDPYTTADRLAALLDVPRDDLVKTLDGDLSRTATGNSAGSAVYRRWARERDRIPHCREFAIEAGLSRPAP
jgi:hypothetical protein